MNRYAFFALVALGVGIRCALLANYGLVSAGEADVYLADEGIVGLMGKHISEGREFPVFFYGQAYLGALESYAAALSFWLFGPTPLALHLVTLTFSVAAAALVYRFTYEAYSVAAARWATAVVAVAPMYFLQWNLKPRGGFVEHLVLVLLVMLFYWRYEFHHDRRPVTLVALGFTMGVALWVNQLAVLYVAVVVLGLLIRDRTPRTLAMVAVPALLGASLLIGYNVVYPLSTARALVRKAVVLNHVPVEERDDGWLARGLGKRVEAGSEGLEKLGVVFGVPPARDVGRLGLSKLQRDGGTWTPLRRWLLVLPFAVFGLALASAAPRPSRRGGVVFGSDQLLFVMFLATFVVGYVNPRYMLPAYPLAAILTAVGLTRLAGRGRAVASTAVAAVLAFNVLGWADAATIPEGDEKVRGRALLDFLEAEGLERCYAAAPLYHWVFESRERVILAPLQKDRYPAYGPLVEASDSICYVFRDDQRRKRQHVAFVGVLEDKGVRYRTGRAGPYNILYDFDRREVLTADVMRRVQHQETVHLGIDSLVGRDNGEDDDAD